MATVTAETGVIQLAVLIVATDGRAGVYSGPNAKLSGRQRRGALDSERKMGRKALRSLSNAPRCWHPLSFTLGPEYTPARQSVATISTAS